MLCLPHVGGRYANLNYAHDKALERSVEVHSDWGTFDWLLEDAFAAGGRVGIAANSDGHKGRQGASHPGASLFGAYGGLTCYLARDLSREALWDAMLWRRQYATTGALRAHCDAWLRLDAPAALHRDDPALGGAPVGSTDRAGLGAILTGVAGKEAEFCFELLAATPVERVEIRNRTRLLETWRPYAPAELGRRIRILWEGSEYRGRGRETMWRGALRLSGNAWRDVRPISHGGRRGRPHAYPGPRSVGFTCRAGTRRRSASAWSSTCLSNAPACTASSTSITLHASRKRSRNSLDGCAKNGCSKWLYLTPAHGALGAESCPGGS